VPVRAARVAGVPPPRAELITALFEELRNEGRTLLVSSHDVASARDFDLVLCLNGRQVAFGRPAAVLRRQTLQETYGHELVVLDELGSAPVVAVQHHEH
jgi:manganese/iron transport system ATP-binding protein/manganese/zinc/iron transport system ATP- binding protein